MKYIILIISVVLMGCASEPNYKYNTIEDFLHEYMIQQYMESQEVQMLEVEDETIMD